MHHALNDDGDCCCPTGTQIESRLTEYPDYESGGQEFESLRARQDYPENIEFSIAVWMLRRSLKRNLYQICAS